MKTETYNVRGVELLQPVAFPHYTKFSDLFDFHTTDKEQAPSPRYVEGEDYNIHTSKTFKVREQVGPYCSLRMIGENYRSSLWVQCTDAVLSNIAENMLILDRDSISFEIVEHDNGKALVIARYSLIIGSRWLAYIDAESVPKGE